MDVHVKSTEGVTRIESANFCIYCLPLTEKGRKKCYNSSIGRISETWMAVMLHNFWAGTKKEAKTLKMKERSGDGH